VSTQPHIIDGEFQSDKYPNCPRGKVPLSVKDPTAQDLLWEYAQRRRAVDAEFADDLETCLRAVGYDRLAKTHLRAASCDGLAEARLREVSYDGFDGESKGTPQLLDSIELSKISYVIAGRIVKSLEFVEDLKTCAYWKIAFCHDLGVDLSNLSFVHAYAYNNLAVPDEVCLPLSRSNVVLRRLVR
jgi:hypothetical protein